jgi:hypothetical protein
VCASKWAAGGGVAHIILCALSAIGGRKPDTNVALRAGPARAAGDRIVNQGFAEQHPTATGKSYIGRDVIRAALLRGVRGVLPALSVLLGLPVLLASVGPWWVEDGHPVCS